MTNQNIFDEAVFTALIKQASSVLKLSEQQIRENFSPYPFCVIDYYEDERKKDRIVEIRFDKEQATITCSFNADKECDCSFIFLDKSEPLTDYIDFFNSRYKYDYIGCRWIFSDCFLSLKSIKDGACFMCC